MNPKFKISFKKSAYKELDALPEKIRAKILDAITLLSINPYTDLLQIKKLKGQEGLYRFRIQDYRVVYSLNSKLITIVIIKIGHRKEVY